MKNEKSFKKFISEEDLSQLSYQARKDKSNPTLVKNKFTGIKYSGINLSSDLKYIAEKIVKKLEDELEDTASKASISGRGTTYGTAKDKIVFKIDFEDGQTFVAVVSPDPSDLPGKEYPSFDPEKNYTRDGDGNVVKPFSKEPTGYSPAIIGNLSNNPRRKFASLKEMLRAKPKITAGFSSKPNVTDTGKVTSQGSIKNLDSVSFISDGTKKMIKNFLEDLAIETFSVKNIDKKMLDTIKSKFKKTPVKESLSFKEKIKNMASKIAGVKEEYESDKINLPDAIKAKINSMVTNQKDLALALLDLMREIVANEPGMENIENMAWKDIVALLQRKAGMSTSKDAEKTPDVSKSDMDKNALPDVDKLMETFNRINKK